MAQEANVPEVLIGLIGESPNDTKSVRVLLERRYGKRLRFVALSPGITGAQLENPKLQKIVVTNYRFEKPALIVVSRDLDAPASDRAKKLERLLFFRRINRGLERKAVYLLHVQAMEALIAADIKPFNDRYTCACVVPADPTTIADPAQFLKEATARCPEHYDEGHCAALLAEANYDKLLANCRYFAAFD